jgi:hypothetical protein
VHFSSTRLVFPATSSGPTCQAKAGRELVRVPWAFCWGVEGQEGLVWVVFWREPCGSGALVGRCFFLTDG